MPRTGHGMTPIALRAATPADSEFCYQLHKAAMGCYITAIWGWDEQVQRAFQGIGTLLISALADEARRKGQDVVLEVLTVNHRAQALYQRLGMKEVARHGDSNIKITMRLTRRSAEPRQAPDPQVRTNAHDDRSSHQDPGRPPR